MGGLPQPDLSVMGCLEAENPFVPVGIMGKANVFNLEIRLPSFPFRRPGQMRLVQLLT
jgi:hypothetical protein